MSLTLNRAQLEALSETNRILVSPLSHPSGEAWRTAVHDAIRSLFHADQTMTIMAGAGELVVSEDVDPATLRSLRSWFDPVSAEGHLVMSDPVVNEWNDRRRSVGLHVFTRDLIDRVIDHRVLESPYVNEALAPNGIHFWQGVYGRGIGGTEAVLWVSYDRPRSKVFGEESVDVLSLLAPAFQSGLAALARLPSARAALDDLAQPLLVFDLTGRELHRSPAATGVLTSDGAAPLVARATTLARRLGADVRRRGGAAEPLLPALEVIRAGGREYVLRVTLLPAGLLSPDPAVGVLIVPRGPAVLPDAETLQALHGLTAREAEVARHLATGATRAAIAAALGLSPHTVRAHTEKVFAKLGVSTRGAVAAALVGGLDPLAE